MKYFRSEPFGGLVFDPLTFTTTFTVESSGSTAMNVVKPAAFARTDILSAPVAVYFELTRRCNLHCIQCFASCRHSEQPELDTASVKQALRQLFAAGVINVRFTGGEPSLRSDLLEILDFAKELGLVVSLQTNGVYSDPEGYVSRLAAVNCDQITVSIDGLGDVHDALRGSGSFSAVEKALHAFAVRGVKIRLNLLAHRQNLVQFPEIFAFAAANSCGINIFHIRPIGRARDLTRLLLSVDDVEILAEKVQELSAKYPALSTACSIKGSQRRPAPIDIPVPAGFTALCLAADGSIWPHHYSCYLDARHRLGQLPGDDLPNLWAFSPALNEFRKMVQEYFKNCDKCLRHGKTCYGFDFEALIIEKKFGIQSSLCSNFREL